jgi:hypothetical protein
MLIFVGSAIAEYADVSKKQKKDAEAEVSLDDLLTEEEERELAELNAFMD